MHATTDWRFLCRPISLIQAVRQLSAGKSRLAQHSSPGSPRGEEGGQLRNTSRGGAERPRGAEARRACEARRRCIAIVRRSAPRRRPLREGGGARLRARQPKRGLQGLCLLHSAHTSAETWTSGFVSFTHCAQHECNVQNVAFAFGQRPQLRWLGTCKCAAWAQRAGCILCIWTRARLAVGLPFAQMECLFRSPVE